MTALRSDFIPTTKTILHELQTKGFACLESALDPAWLSQAQDEVDTLLDRHGHRFFSIVRPGSQEGSAAKALVEDQGIKTLLAELTEAVCPQQNPEDIYNVMRIIAGPEGATGSLQMHYDASVITAVVPVHLPQSFEGSGALVTMANRRPLRRFVLTNLIEKAAVQNRLYWKRASKEILARPEAFAQPLATGNIYLFWGYRTYHGNLPCAPNSKRATILLHYGNPHGSSRVLKGIRGMRRVVEAIRLKATG